MLKKERFLIILDNIDKLLLLIENSFCILILAFIIIITFIEVFFRYVLEDTIMIGISEIIIWCFVWISFIGCASLFQQNKHIGIEYFAMKCLNNDYRKIISFFINLYYLIFFVVIIKSGVNFSLGQWIIKSTSADIPKTFLYISIPISMILMSYHMIVKSIRSFYK
jgi:TRAP-type transport system small permease protein